MNFFQTKYIKNNLSQVKFILMKNLHRLCDNSIKIMGIEKFFVFLLKCQELISGKKKKTGPLDQFNLETFKVIMSFLKSIQLVSTGWYVMCLYRAFFLFLYFSFEHNFFFKQSENNQKPFFIFFEHFIKYSREENFIKNWKNYNSVTASLISARG